ncbi:MAG: SET domain-containing protein-lysine N-methyltransferase [Acidobacteria bacterium]|nr:SET domain-containing protein-lysine N-methyltransferase [Acidobacteriota bacterium]
MACSSTTPQTVPEISARHARYRISVRPSEIHRWGVFAEEFIPKGRKIIEYTGERISRRETAKRAGKKLNYLFTLDSYWTLDGSVGGSGAEFINHSCDPNVYAWILKGHILYMAERDIHPGEELTIDYRFDADVEKVDCGCGSPKCRGMINLPKAKKPRKVRRKSASKKKRAR